MERRYATATARKYRSLSSRAKPKRNLAGEYMPAGARSLLTRETRVEDFTFVSLRLGFPCAVQGSNRGRWIFPDFSLISSSDLGGNPN